MHLARLLFAAMILAGPTDVFGGSAEGGTAGAPVPAGTAFTYQGQLKRLGVPVDGLIDARFSLWSHPTSTDPADQVGETLALDGIEVTNGLFSVQLDFGSSAFNGEARWLQVEVRESGEVPLQEPSPQPSPQGRGGAAAAGTYSTLVPREPITPSPYSLQTRGIFVDSLGRVGIGTQTPNSKLEVAGDGGVLLQLNGGVEPGIRFRDSTGAAGSIGGKNGSLTFRPEGWALGDPLLTMQGSSGGKVGIGHAAPAAKVDVLGYWDGEHGALTLRGLPTLRMINLGCASQLGNCSWIMHMNGGNLEFSRKTAATTWTPVLSLSAFGSIDIGLEVVQSGFLPSPAQAACPAGKRVISGGCWCAGNLGASQPNGNNWFCECRSGATAYAYAFCARIQ